MNEQGLMDAGIDLKELKERLMGNTSLIRRFVAMYLQDTTFLTLEAACARGDAQAGLSASHTLKGMCGNLALKELFGLFRSQVQCFRSGREEEAWAMMEEISPAFQETSQKLKDWLAQDH